MPYPPDPGEAEVLQDVQELGLEGQGKIGDLVEVDRSLVRVLELPGLSSVRSGEGSLFVAEQFGLEKLLRDRRTVDLDERAMAAPRGGVDGAGDEILADAALPTEQHRRVRIRNALDHRPDRPHPGAPAEQRSVLGRITCAADRPRDRFHHRSAALVERML